MIGRTTKHDCKLSQWLIRNIWFCCGKHSWKYPDDLLKSGFTLANVEN